MNWTRLGIGTGLLERVSYQYSVVLINMIRLDVAVMKESTLPKHKEELTYKYGSLKSNRLPQYVMSSLTLEVYIIKWFGMVKDSDMQQEIGFNESTVF